MKRHPLSIVRLFALVCVALASLTFGAASAQDVPTEIGFTVASFSCESDPGRVSLAAGNIPDSCTPDAGAVANVTLEDGTAVGTCTTDANGLCTLQAPNEAPVVVTLDGSTVASGNTPRENPITTQVVTEFAGALFINLPATPAPTEVPTGLPDTGTGVAEESSRFWISVASFAVIGTSSAALGLRLQYGRSASR
jgi:hypothetical protein